LLSPTEQEGLVAQIRRLLEGALGEQRSTILREFSLDNKNSAICRFLSEITTKQGELNQGLQGKIDGVVNEFSLDQPTSALSRLVTRVEHAQEAISEQFSSDNENSALNKLSSMLHNTSEQIDRNLTLDNENSALYRLKREIQNTLDSILQSNAQFYIDVRTTLAALDARKTEAGRSTRHGDAFEDQFGEVLAAEAQRFSDIFEHTGKTTGNIRNCKKGDYVTALGEETPAPGVRIVWEVKEDKSWDVRQALIELDEATKNREAQVGVFVFSKTTAPLNIDSFSRYGNKILIVWDSSNATSDLMVRIAYSVARALVVRESKKSTETDDAIHQIETASRAIEKQIGHLDEVQKWAETVKGNGDKIVAKTESMRRELSCAIDRVNTLISSLKTNS